MYIFIMYYCPECNYSFDISKLTKSKTKKTLETVEDAIKRYRAGKDLSDYSANFSKEELLKHKKIIKLSKEEKDSFSALFENTSTFEKIEFKCVNCNFRKPINSSIKLYEIDFIEDNVSKFKSISENKLLFNNPIYPRTKDYTCKNINCITHKDKKNKEAVFYKDNKTNHLVYICGVCFTNWG